jgi:hypothetical protein
MKKLLRAHRKTADLRPFYIQKVSFYGALTREDLLLRATKRATIYRLSIRTLIAKPPNGSLAIDHPVCRSFLGRSRDISHRKSSPGSIDRIGGSTSRIA